MAVTIYLRELERTDLPRLTQWRNDPGLVDLLGANFLYIGPEIDIRWFDQYLLNRDKAVRLAIIAAEAGAEVHIGNVNLTGVHFTNKAAEFSILIGDKAYWSGGFGPVAVKQMLSHGFLGMNLHRIHLSLLQTNERAHRMYQRLGFREEGVQLQAVFKDGRYHDILSMAMLRPDFDKVTQNW